MDNKQQALEIRPDKLWEGQSTICQDLVERQAGSFMQHKIGKRCQSGRAQFALQSLTIRD